MARLLEELSELEKLALIDMSYSRINTYDMCPAKYFYGYIAKEPWMFSAPAALGNIVHDVLEDHLGEDELDLGTMTVLFEQYRDDHDPDREISFELVEAAHVMMAEFVDRHDDEEFKILAKEQAFELVVGSCLVRGFIDRVDWEPDGVRIIDYKTGKFEESGKNIGDNLQLGIYALASSFIYPDVDVFHCELYYLRSGRRKAFRYTRDEMPVLEERIIERLDTIINDFYFHETKTKEYVCSFCEHATSGACRTGVVRRARRAKR